MGQDPCTYAWSHARTEVPRQGFGNGFVSTENEMKACATAVKWCTSVLANLQIFHYSCAYRWGQTIFRTDKDLVGQSNFGIWKAPAWVTNRISIPGRPGTCPCPIWVPRACGDGPWMPAKHWSTPWASSIKTEQYSPSKIWMFSL